MSSKLQLVEIGLFASSVELVEPALMTFSLRPVQFLPHHLTRPVVYSPASPDFFFRAR